MSGRQAQLSVDTVTTSSPMWSSLSEFRTGYIDNSRALASSAGIRVLRKSSDR